MKTTEKKLFDQLWNRAREIALEHYGTDKDEVVIAIMAERSAQTRQLKSIWVDVNSETQFLLMKQGFEAMDYRLGPIRADGGKRGYQVNMCLEVEA